MLAWWRHCGGGVHTRRAISKRRATPTFGARYGEGGGTPRSSFESSPPTEQRLGRVIGPSVGRLSGRGHHVRGPRRRVLRRLLSSNRREWRPQSAPCRGWRRSGHNSTIRVNDVPTHQFHPQLRGPSTPAGIEHPPPGGLWPRPPQRL